MEANAAINSEFAHGPELLPWKATLMVKAGLTEGIFPSSWARRKAERLESSMILTEYEPEPRATFSSSDTEKANLLSFDADRIRGAIVPSSKRAYSDAVTSSTSISTTCATLDVTVISVDANTCGDPTSL